MAMPGTEPAYLADALPQSHSATLSKVINPRAHTPLVIVILFIRLLLLPTDSSARWVAT